MGLTGNVSPLLLRGLAMVRRRQQFRQEQATSRCAWCSKPLAPDDEVFAVGARAKPWVKLPDAGALEVSLGLGHRRVFAVVPAGDSPAKQAGNDLLFATCSQVCGQALREALQKQIDFGIAA